MKTLNIKDPEAHRLAEAISKETGVSMTRVVTEALRERFNLLPSRRRATAKELRAIARSAGAPANETYSQHADPMYDDHGLPQ